MSEEKPLDLTDTIASMKLRQGITEWEAFEQIMDILAIKAEVYGIPQHIKCTVRG